MKIVRAVAIALGLYVALGLVLDAAIGLLQPRSADTAVLRTFDDAGHSRDTVLSLLEDAEDGGQLWIESGHWFRGWYQRVTAHPDVVLMRGDSALPYHAVPVDTPEAIERITRLMGKGEGAGYWVGRLILLWAPIKPVRLDPVS